MRFVSDLRLLTRRFLDDKGFLLAAAISFSFLLCLAPLALLLFSAMGFLLQSDEIVEYVLNTAAYLLPGYGDKMMQAIVLLTEERKATGVLGAVGLAIFATQLFSLIRTVLNLAFRVRRRGFVHGFAFDLFAIATLGFLSVAFSAVILTVVTLGNLAIRFAPPELLPSIRWGRLVALPLMYLAQVGLLFWMYRAFPNTSVPPRAAAIATLAVTALWEVARWAFGAYLANFGLYGKLYGSLGVVVAALMWIYYSATIFVFGAEVAGYISEQEGGERRGAREEPRFSEARAD
ncbi:MAG: YihY/virulence factor BrkB family protein [bacterium]